MINYTQTKYWVEHQLLTKINLIKILYACMCLYERIETESPRVGLPIQLLYYYIGSLIGVASHKAFSVYVQVHSACVYICVLKWKEWVWGLN